MKLNIAAIKPQVAEIVIVDNDSKNKEVLRTLECQNVTVIYNKENLGIAAALNTIMKYCGKYGYEWAITLDQDSVCPDNYIETASRVMTEDNVGQVVPILFESNTGRYYLLSDKLEAHTYQIVHKSITSAAITNYEAWKQIKGFDEGLFIDYVDYDYAYRLQEKGYKIIRVNSVKLDHHMGDSTLHGFGPVKLRVANHSAFRKYYISRNIIVFMRRYGRKGHLFAEILRLNKMIMLMLLFEKDKQNKIKAVRQGIVDGLKYMI